jgi:crooked neck
MATSGPPRVKNKAAAPIQISAEQLLREAVDRQEPGTQAPTTRFGDLEELHEHQGRRRREFENRVRRNRQNLTSWLTYAGWELEQKEFARARSVFERALDVHATSVPLWLRYADAELKTRNIQHARNLLDRAVTLLPRVDRLWWKYLHTLEVLGDVAGAREVFERWMRWEPDASAWAAYVKFESRYHEWDRARAVWERLTAVHPEPSSWRKWAKWEKEHGTTDLVRAVYAMAIETLGEEFMDERVIIEFARFETGLKEYERSRALYKLGLDILPRSRSRALNDDYVRFCKAYGDVDGVEDAVLSKRRVKYEEEVKRSPRNYDAWLDLARLEETLGDLDRTREVYERAIAQLPPSKEKRHWRRYVYLFLFYATFEETMANDLDRTAQIYQQCLKVIPHEKFTFAKVWINKARFEIRRMELAAARKTLGQAIGRCPKDKLFREYIDLEVKLFEFARCRTLYEKYVAHDPGNSAAWKAFAELERGLDDADRARAIFELAVAEGELDMPELVWKEYIDFEADEGEHARARALYERLLERTGHVKVWIAYAQFEINVPDDDDGGDEREGGGREEEQQRVSDAAKERARAVFRRADAEMGERGRKDDRFALLAAWRAFEAAHGTAEQVAAAEARLPKQVRKRRKRDDESYEEFVDLVFPGDEGGAGGAGSKMAGMLQAAMKWREEQQARESAVS